MPCYELNCDKCDYNFEIVQSMKKKLPKKCPKCKEKSLYQVYHVNGIIDSKKPKTIGDLANKTTEKMVKEGKLHKSALEYDQKRKERTKKFKRTETLAKMTPKQKEAYIMTGKM